MIKTIAWEKGCIKIIDQTLLPNRLRYVYCRNTRALWYAIKTMKIRGAPALGIAGGFGIVLGLKGFKPKDSSELLKKLDDIIHYLGSSRPTAVNLFWALERMRSVALKNLYRPFNQLKGILFEEAISIYEEDRGICRKMAEYGARLIEDGDRLLTHCNAGALATADFGTALGVIYTAASEGKRLKVYVDETRPLLQGARLTAWELKHSKIDVTLICDSMAATLMAQGGVDKVLVGADRIASNGDTANKIGTYNLAVLCEYHKIPFYIVAPVSSFDFNLKSGRDIPIEQRDSDEIFEFSGHRIAPRGIKAFNPAFDVTPNRLITAIVTEKGIFRKPFSRSLRKLRSVG